GWARLPHVAVSPDAETWLTIDAVLAAATAWAPEGHLVATAQLDYSVRRPAPAVRPRKDWHPGDGTLTLGSAEFVSGSLAGLAGRAVTGPRLELFRAPTDNDESASDGVAGSDASIPEVSHAELWRSEGLDRLTSRRLSVSHAADALRTLDKVSAANSAAFVMVESVWSLEDGELELRVEIEPSSGWRTVWPRIGIRFDLPDGNAPIDGAEWFGLGPLESYPDSLRAARTGRFASTIEDLTVDYARPQESGHRSRLRRLTLSSGDAEVLRLEALPDRNGHLPGYTLSRHTPQQIAKARHAFELPESTTSHLTIDAAQHGLGSRACGPDVQPEFALRPQARTIRLRFGGSGR
ncbi:beta-galactosidase, partial [Streptomyces sp. WAC 05379]|uniref:beta-galactosidase domain 4-containing protein n=1 Tax=Streptomyces sp. WAC 05379 TaxID=2203207 RepID=UPI001000AE9B